jgi:hypothetical protein
MLISIITIVLKETILIDLAGNIRFISPLVGASKHDVVHLSEQIQKIKSTLSSDEELILDKGYQGIEEAFESNIVHVKHKKPKGKTLCEKKIGESIHGKNQKKNRIGDWKYKKSFCNSENKVQNDLEISWCLGYFLVCSWPTHQRILQLK